jgi:hypothetical protein
VTRLLASSGLEDANALVSQFLLANENSFQVVAVGVGVVSDDFQNLGDESCSGSPFDVDEQVEGVGDVAFDRPISSTLLCRTQLVKRLMACTAELA